MVVLAHSVRMNGIVVVVLVVVLRVVATVVLTVGRTVVIVVRLAVVVVTVLLTVGFGGGVLRSLNCFVQSSNVISSIARTIEKCFITSLKISNAEESRTKMACRSIIG